MVNRSLIKSNLIAVPLWLLFIAFTGCSPQKSLQADIRNDSLALRKAVIRTGTAFNEKLTDTILAFYAKDIIVSFPGVPDTKYEDFVKAFDGLKTADVNLQRFTRDSIEEIILSGDLAVVRVNWITTTIDKAQANEVTRVARDLQVWRKEKNGKWKFIRGMWFREPHR